MLYSSEVSKLATSGTEKVTGCLGEPTRGSVSILGLVGDELKIFTLFAAVSLLFLRLASPLGFRMGLVLVLVT
jgi:hypothetical protein